MPGLDAPHRSTSVAGARAATFGLSAPGTRLTLALGPTLESVLAALTELAETEDERSTARPARLR
jgi:hypothetical protein